MRPKHWFLFLIVLLGRGTSLAHAQLRVINESAYPMSLAFGFPDSTGGITTKGWLRVNPHDSLVVQKTALYGGAYYYLARVEGCDERLTGPHRLWVHPREAFAVADAQLAKPRTAQTGLVRSEFVKVLLPAGQLADILRLRINCTRNSVREGEWRLYLDRDKMPVPVASQATYVRTIHYQNGVPTGIVRDHWAATARPQWEGKLAAENPDVRQGTCTTYDEQGRRREEAFYEHGRVVGAIRRWHPDGRLIVRRKVKHAVPVLPAQTGYLFSVLNPSSSRVVLPVRLPPGTVEWFYQFTASRDKEEVATTTARFKLLAELTRLIDETGITATAIKAFTGPTGGDVCEALVFTDAQQADRFRENEACVSLKEHSRENLTSARVPVAVVQVSPFYLGLRNPSWTSGIHYVIEVVAITEEEVEE